MWFEGYFCIPTMCGTTGKVTRERLARHKNAIAFQNTFSRFLQDALDAIDVEGLPETMSKRVILQSILWYGGVVLFEKSGGLFSLPGAPTGDGFNMYGDPGKAWVWTRNGQMNEQINLAIPGGDENSQLEIMTSMQRAGKGNGVFVWDNALRFPFVNQVIFYAEAVADTYRTLDVMRANLKRPYIFFSEESTLASINKFLQERDENVDAISAVNTGAFDVNKIKMIPLDTGSQNLRDCTEIIEWYENKYRELLGINSNTQIDKKGENLISAELTVNNEFEDMQISKRLDYLNKTVELFNKLYGTNIKFVEKHKGEVENVDNEADRNEDVLPDQTGN